MNNTPEPINSNFQPKGRLKERTSAILYRKTAILKQSSQTCHDYSKKCINSQHLKQQQ